MPPQDPRIGTTLDGLYPLSERLGEGGVGTVYRSWHPHLQRPVAIKLLHPQFAQLREPLERFHLEARLLSGLGHPSFVTVYDFAFAQEDGAAYLVMELVQGESLRRRFQDGRVLSIGEVLALYEPLCEAMGQAHRAKVLHRDLKPDNLMLMAGGGVKILDFGMAKLMSDHSHLTAPKVVMGTPNYIAPERARGFRDADERSDIFSLGAILYEALTGRFAFHGSDPVATMYQVLRAPVPALDLQDRQLSRRLDDVIATACTKDPRDRYQSVKELWQALDGAARGAAPGEPAAGGRTEPRTSGAPAAISQAHPGDEPPPTIKVAIIHAFFDFIRGRFAQRGLDHLCNEFGRDRVEHISAQLPTAKMDASVLNELHDTANRLFDDGSLDLMRDLGGHFAELALKTVYKAFLTPAGPETLVKRIHKMYTMMTDAGEARVSALPGGRWLMLVRGLSTLTPSMTAATAGWVRKYLELAGATEIDVKDRFLLEGGRPLGEIVFSYRAPQEEEAEV